MFLFPISWSESLIVLSLFLFFGTTWASAFLKSLFLQNRVWFSKYFMTILMVVRFWLICILPCQLKKWAVLFHDTWSNDSLCNNAWFIHKLSKRFWIMHKKLRNWKTELSWTKYRVFSLWEQSFLRYITWNLVAFSRLINICKVTEWMIFLEYSWMNESLNRQARKSRKLNVRKKPSRNSASLMLNKIVVLRNCAKPVPKPLFIETACSLLATLLKKT